MRRGRLVMTKGIPGMRQVLLGGSCWTWGWCPTIELLSVAGYRGVMQGKGISSDRKQYQEEEGKVETPFEKILVANRGEIAVRIMKTVKKMGMQTVGVYSDADRDAVHVRYADEAVYVGKSPSRESYLKIDAILGAMEKTGADAVHPGYGFLSENAAFVEQVEKHGFTCIGPPSHAVKLMGDKAESKMIAHNAGVRTIPGWIGIVQDKNHAASIAADIGYPVMIKASGGGGGKGLRIAYTEAELYDMFDVAVDEAASSFGDSRMLIEKFIEEPRHIEIQVLGDTHGNILYLPERECSIQRRNQKVIEEAPSPVGTPDLRQAMGNQAVALARAVGYYSAGTCEFLVDKHLNFYFLEMNTRLQVEHAITEAITGLDLVEEMIHIAAGKKLDYDQKAMASPIGAAIECRVYAEDPARGYLPSTGYLKAYKEPLNARVDSGVKEGSEISMYYDAMISKVITEGPDRATARARAADALDSYIIRGVQNNIPLLRSCLENPDFVSGLTPTSFLKTHYPTLHSLDPLHLPLSDQQEAEALVFAVSQYIWNQVWLMGSGIAKHPMEWDLYVHDGTQEGSDSGTVVHVRRAPDAMCFRPVPLGSRIASSKVGIVSPMSDSVSPTSDTASLRANTPMVPLEVSGKLPIGNVCMIIEADASMKPGVLGAAPHATLWIQGDRKSYQTIASSPRAIHIQYSGAQRRFLIDSAENKELTQIMPPPIVVDTSLFVSSPMPGVIIDVRVQPGDIVKAGDEVAVVEAMKMQNQLKSVCDGTVDTVDVKSGDHVEADQVLIRFSHT